MTAGTARGTAVRLTGLGVVVFVAGLVAVAFVPEGSRIASWWPAIGVAVAFVVRSPRSLLAPIAGVVWVAVLLANLVGGRSLTMSVCFALANAVELAVAGHLLTSGRPAVLAEPRDLVRLGAASLAGAASAGVVGAVTIAATGGALLPSLWGITASHASAIMLLVPLSLRVPVVCRPAPLPQVAASWVSALCVTGLVFGPGQTLPLAFLVIPWLVWAGVRLGHVHASAQLLAVSALMSVLTAEGAGPFANAARGAGPRAAALLIQLFVIASCLVVLSLVVLVVQRELALTGLADQRTFVERVLETLETGVIVCGADGSIVSRNAAQRRLTGVPDGVTLTPEQVRARLEVLDEDGRHLSLSDSPLWRALAGEDVDRLRARIGVIGQPLRDVVVTARSVHNEAGVLLGAVAVSVDVTEERRVQADLRRSVAAIEAREAELARSNDDLGALARASKTVLSGGDARTALCEAVIDVTGALGAVLLEPDEARTSLHSTRSAGRAPDLTVPLSGLSRSGLAFTTGRVQLVPDVRADAAIDPRVLELFDEACGHGALQAAAFVPLVEGGSVRGVLGVALGTAVAAADVRLLGLLDVLVADGCLAMSREDLAVELAAQAVTDPLTGLPNRRRWDDELLRARAVSERSGTPYVVLVLDLDRFKNFNDSFGHPAGDALLQQAAHSFRSALRTDDVIVRLGGEEFGVLLRDCPPEPARLLAERLIVATPLGQTCSIGMAVSSRGESTEAVFSRADIALYAAKQGGRARVCVAAPLVPAARLPAALLPVAD